MLQNVLMKLVTDVQRQREILLNNCNDQGEIEAFATYFCKTTVVVARLMMAQLKPNPSLSGRKCQRRRIFINKNATRLTEQLSNLRNRFVFKR